MTRRTVTLATADAGTITIPCPSWCDQGNHDLPDDVAHRPHTTEIAHTGPSINITVGTHRGPRALLEMMLWADPFPVPSSPHGKAVHVVARLLDGDHFGYDLDGLNGLVTDLLEAAGRVRRVATQLAAETHR